MPVDDDDIDDFEELLRDIDRDACEAADAHFEELYDISHGDANSKKHDEDDSLFGSSGEEDPQYALSAQRVGNLKLKLEADASGSFPVSSHSLYCDDRWVLIEKGENSEVYISYENVRDDLKELKRVISYYVLPTTNPFGTIRSYVSSMNYADAFKFVQQYVFEENRVDGSTEGISVISASMLNESLDSCKARGSPHAYNMMFFVVVFWLSLSAQKLVPAEYCVSVKLMEVDTARRRQDVLETIRSTFVGWKPFSEVELGLLLSYACFWIDDAIPVMQNIRVYLESSKLLKRKAYVKLNGDKEFESVLGKKVKGVEIVGFTQRIGVQRQRGVSGQLRTYYPHRYNWRNPFRRAIDRVRNAVFIFFALMTGMRKREMASLKFDNIVKGDDGIWRVHFARYKTSSDPNYFGDADHISIPGYLGDAIEAYKELRLFYGSYSKGYLFQPTCTGVTVNLTDRMLARVGSNVAQEVGVPHLHLHRFRKTIAELLIHESEANIDVIRMIFGHSSYVMTLRYIARNPFLVSSVVETLKEHFAEDFVDVVGAIHTGVYAGDAAHRIADQMQKRPELFTGKVLKTTIMQYVSHLFEGGSSIQIQRTSLGTICMSEVFHERDVLPPCLASASVLIFPVKPDFSNCHIHCTKNVILQSSQHAIEHNIKFYRTILLNRDKLKADAIKELEQKISVNHRLLKELIQSSATTRARSSKDNYND